MQLTGRLLLLPFLVLSAGCAQPRSRIHEAGAATAGVDVAGIIELARQVRNQPPEGLAWLDDAHYLVMATASEGSQLHKVEARSGNAVVLYDAAAMAAALAALPDIDAEAAAGLARRSRYTWLPEHAGMLLRHKGAVFVYRLGGAARRVTSPGEVVGEALSPDGGVLAFVRNGDLYAVSLESDREVRLTHDGGPEILNGRLDWVYQEEIYGRGDFNGYWWSPDSSRIAFLRLDESPVGEFRIEDHRPTLGSQQVWRYPKAGDPNPLVQVGFVGLGGGEPVWADLEAWPPEDRLVLRVDWKPDSRAVVLQVANRIQDRMTVLFADPRTGATRTAFEERTQSWARRSELTWLPDGGFLFLSGRDGWRHLYHYAADGSLVRQVTRGEFEVLSVLKVSSDGAAVYAEANPSSLLERHVWSFPLDGGAGTQITAGRGTHRYRLSPGAVHGFHTWSHAGDPGATELVEVAAGRPLRVLSAGDRSLLARHGYTEPEFLRVENRNGFQMEAMAVKPAGFRTDRRNPVLVYTYGGPHAPSVRDRWGGFRALWHHALAAEGYLVWTCDNQSASGRSHAAASVMYKRAGVTELADLEDSLDWLVTRGWADPQRIGIWGWSYGGFLAAFALTHSDRFRVGMAGAPVTDWRNYDTIYTERYMSTPQANPEGYAASSVLERAADLHGSLLLMHGTIDENVHMSNSIQFVDALQKAGKHFDLMLYPGSRHGVVQPQQRRHLYEMMTAFVLEKL